MPYNDPGHWKFMLSHVQKEADAEALDLSIELGKDDCWLALKMKEKGEEAMKEAVMRSDFFVCILSESYFEREFCIKEMNWALEFQKPIISTYKRGTRIGDVLNKAPPMLSSIKGIDSIEVNRADLEFFAVSLMKILRVVEIGGFKMGRIAGESAGEASALMSAMQAMPPCTQRNGESVEIEETLASLHTQLGKLLIKLKANSSLRCGSAVATGETVPRNKLYESIPFNNYRNSPFHKINLQYPGLQLINEKPYIFIVNQFLSASECFALISKIGANAKKQSASAPSLGANPVSGERSSVGCVATLDEVSSLRAKFERLLWVPQTHMQYSKLSKYDPGAQFSQHSDALVGDKSVEFDRNKDYWNEYTRQQKGIQGLPFPGANRFCTVFVYLNTCERGGCTSWKWTRRAPSFYEKPTALGWDDMKSQHTKSDDWVTIKPEQGMAVVHFPSLTPDHGGLTDPNAMHEGQEAIDTKYIVQQFVYSHPLDWENGSECAAFQPGNRPSGRLNDFEC
ncbi:hypothetical protein AB1Y20_010509 [Prymnesium parvum]|uniref:Prolyl 4-hydroxylase alpha subunit domain-containing protein n=1 Tax=Prymnesium parvum TaxID=97485 RepID=A0AB34IRL7_PRYPA